MRESLETKLVIKLCTTLYTQAIYKYAMMHRLTNILIITKIHVTFCHRSTPSHLTNTHTHTHTHQAPQVPLLVVWCTPGGGGPHVLTLLEHSYCTLEGQLEVIILIEEVEPTTSVLPEQPEYSTYTAGVQSGRAYLYGAEYQTGIGGDIGPLRSFHDHNVPCAVCYASTRETVVMIPAQITCPSSWTREYYGYLMAEHHSIHHHRSTFECVDQSPQSVPGSHANTNGALFYHVEVKCNGIPCPPYDAQKEVTCVVCTK